MIDQALNAIRDQLARIPRGMRQDAISTLGMIALATPLMLWMAWSPLMFRIVLYGGVTAIFLIYMLIWSSPDETL